MYFISWQKRNLVTEQEIGRNGGMSCAQCLARQKTQFCRDSIWIYGRNRQVGKERGQMRYAACLACKIATPCRVEWNLYSFFFQNELSGVPRYRKFAKKGFESNFSSGKSAWMDCPGKMKRMQKRCSSKENLLVWNTSEMNIWIRLIKCWSPRLLTEKQE